MLLDYETFVGVENPTVEQLKARFCVTSYGCSGDFWVVCRETGYQQGFSYPEPDPEDWADDPLSAPTVNPDAGYASAEAYELECLRETWEQIASEAELVSSGVIDPWETPPWA